MEVQRESRTIATITFQNFFRLYTKLSGMTGTALTEEDEFKQIYALDVIEVPTNMPMIRIDREDAVFRSRAGKYRAIIRQIQECHAKGQPVLVGTVSIDKSEELSVLLRRAGIPHNVLNAKHHEKEAEIVAQAGSYGAVTISTNMAGRGTDIKLGGNPEFLAKKDLHRLGYEDTLIAEATGTSDTDNEEILAIREKYKELYDKHLEELRPEIEKVREAGGLYILGTERHESRRIDNQLRGRSGRQGDPGESRFFLSLEDDLIRLFGQSERLIALSTRLGLDEDTELSAKLLSGTIENAQKTIESNNFERRKNVLNYDDVMNQQRKVIYAQRKEVLFEDSIADTIERMIVGSVSTMFDICFGSDDPKEWNFAEFISHYYGHLVDSHGFKYTEEELKAIDKDAWKEELVARALEIWRSKDELFRDTPERSMRELEKKLLLMTVDMKWMDHLEALDELREYVGLNAYAQRDPVAIYRLESSELFDAMIDEIKEETVQKILSVDIRRESTQREQVAKVTSEGFAGGEKKVARKPVKSVKIGRNDPCPCGSGKKYKRCCGLND